MTKIAAHVIVFSIVLFQFFLSGLKILITLNVLDVIRKMCCVNRTTGILRIALDTSDPIWKDSAIIQFDVRSSDVQRLRRFYHVHTFGTGHWYQIDHRSSL